MTVQKGTVFLVQDSLEYGEELKVLLEREGFEVFLFSTTADGQKAIEENNGFIDLIITGWVGVDGISIVKEAQKRGIDFLILTVSPHAVPENLQEKVLDKVTAGWLEIMTAVNSMVFWAAHQFYKIIRFGTGFDPVIVVSLPDACPDTADANYYRLASWQIGDQKPEVFNEISRNEALSYFSGIADGIGFEEPPEEIFPTLDAVFQYVAEERNEWVRKRLMER